MGIFDVGRVNELNQLAIAALDKGDRETARQYIDQAKALIAARTVLKFVEYTDHGARAVSVPCRALAGVA